MRYFRQHKRIIPVSLLVMTLLLSALLSAGTATATQVTIDANNNFRVDGKLFFPLMVWLQDYRDATINRSKAIGNQHLCRRVQTRCSQGQNLPVINGKNTT